jgi:hypothetical protein
MAAFVVRLNASLYLLVGDISMDGQISTAQLLEKVASNAYNVLLCFLWAVGQLPDCPTAIYPRFYQLWNDHDMPDILVGGNHIRENHCCTLFNRRLGDILL